MRRHALLVMFVVSLLIGACILVSATRVAMENATQIKPTDILPWLNSGRGNTHPSISAVTPGGSGGGDVLAVITFIPDPSVDYDHTSYVTQILSRHGYPVFVWNAWSRGHDQNCLSNISRCMAEYYNAARNAKIKVWYYYGHTAELNHDNEVSGFILLETPSGNYGVSSRGMWDLYSYVHADFSSALIFVLGCDSFKLRHGAQYQVYIGTDKPISLSVIKQKGKKFWEMLDKGKTAYEAMESIQPNWWEKYIEGKASFELDGDKNWRLDSG
ncbi:hypothetical protein JCM16307_09060 [Thermococcus prieurii]